MCAFEGCGKPADSLGFCGGHYAQLRKGKELTAIRRFDKSSPKPQCAFGGCERTAMGWKDLCATHDAQRARGEWLRPIGERNEPRAPKPQCAFEGCERTATGKQDLCKAHYGQRHRRKAGGKPLTPIGYRAKAEPKLPCSFPGCDRPRRGNQELCESHYQQRWAGKPLKPIQRRISH